MSRIQGHKDGTNHRKPRPTHEFDTVHEAYEYYHSYALAAYHEKVAQDDERSHAQHADPAEADPDCWICREEAT